jgi:hypothetical protein
MGQFGAFSHYWNLNRRHDVSSHCVKVIRSVKKPQTTSPARRNSTLTPGIQLNNVTEFGRLVESDMYCDCCKYIDPNKKKKGFPAARRNACLPGVQYSEEGRWRGAMRTTFPSPRAQACAHRNRQRPVRPLSQNLHSTHEETGT